MELVIDRKTWLRGGPAYKSSLLTDDGKMCCLGFLCVQAGIAKDKLLHFPTPASLGYDINFPLPEVVTKLVGPDNVDSTLCKEMMNVNDDESLSEENREEALKELFSEISVNVTFVD